MLSSFRRLSKSKVGTLILALVLFLIVASFALSDMSSFTSGRAALGGNLATAGDEKLSENELQRTMERALSTIRQQNPEADYSALARDFPAIIEALIDERALASFARDNRFILSRRLIDAEIAKLPATRGLDGKFSQEAYLQFLSNQRLTDADVRRMIAADLTQRLMLGPIAANPKVPVGVATPYAAMLLEARIGQVALVPTASFKAGLAPSDGDLLSFYNQNRIRYMVPEQRVLRIARMTPDLVAGVTPSAAEIAAYYNAHRATYAGKETRVISQAVVQDRKAAEGIAARARGGASFAAAAAPAGFSAEDISVGPQTRAQFAGLAGDKVAAAAFAAAKGGIVGPVQSDLGWHVVKIDEVRTEQGKTLEAARAEIADKLTADKRKEALTDVVTRVEDAIADGSSLAEAAAASKLTLVDTPLITATGADRANTAWKLPADFAPALKSGFELTADDDPVVEALPNDGGYLLVGIGRIVSPAPAPLAQIRDQVRTDWIQKKASDRARAVASAIAAKVAQGVPLGKAVAEAGVTLPAARPLSARRIQLSEAPPALLAPLKMLFSLSQGKSRMVADPRGGGYFIVTSDKIIPGNAMSNPALIAQTQSAFQQNGATELAQQFVRAVRDHVGVKRNDGAIAAARTRITGGGN